MKNRQIWFGTLILTCCALLLLTSGCTAEGSRKTGRSYASAAQQAAGAAAFLQATGLGGANYADAEKVFSNRIIHPGHWEQAEVITLGEVDEELYSLTVSDIRQSYAPGAACEPYLTFIQTKEQQEDARKPVGALYFAVPASEKPALSQDLTVLEYFLKDTTRAPVQLNCFCAENDGYTGNAQDSAGAEHTYFDTKGYFPKKVAEGDEIWLVLDLSDTAAEDIHTRMVWKYIWVFDEEDTALEAAPEDHTGDPDFQKEVYSGHWDRTNIWYPGQDSRLDEEDGRSTEMKRTGSDGREFIYTCRNKDEQIRVRIPELSLDNLYYADDTFIQEIRIYCDQASEEPPGSVRCSLYLGDVSMDENGNITETKPRYYFSEGRPGTDLKEFSPHPHGESMSWRNDLLRGYLMIYGKFPEGSEDGEKLYLVFEAADDLTGEIRMMNLYEYTWKKGPDTVWFYREPMSY